MSGGHGDEVFAKEAAQLGGRVPPYSARLIEVDWSVNPPRFTFEVTRDAVAKAGLYMIHWLEHQ